MKKNLVLIAMVVACLVSVPALSAENEKVQVDAIKEKYWARGDDSELGVVQNRLYTKASKLELGAFFGLVSSDPFLSVQSFGVSAGWHLSEYVAIHALAWKANVGPSSALQTFEATRGATANTNNPKSYLGAEVAWSLLYGKLSLLGQKIIYYDFHVLAGAGATETESGRSFTPSLGVGQQIHLSRLVSLRVDYRLMRYHEDILEKVIPTKLGQVVDERTNWSNVVTIGASFLLGNGGEE